MPLSTGQILNNRYRIVKLLGQGGFGAVYKAWDINLNGPCAVKENFDASSEAARQFAREATILSALRHPSLPRVIDHFTIAGQGQYLVMDFIEGDDLQARIDRAGPQSEPQAVGWICQICDALTYLHSQTPPIIHRDIKPANIKITPGGQAMLVDFGIAKVFDPNLKTTMGARAVTPGFSPFEQYGHGTTDLRTDVYALGATLYALLSGTGPPESIARVGGAPLPSLRSFNPSIARNVESAVTKALEVMPAQRYQSAAEFKTALIAGPAAPAPQNPAANLYASNIPSPSASPILNQYAAPAQPAQSTPIGAGTWSIRPVRGNVTPTQPARSTPATSSGAQGVSPLRYILTIVVLGGLFAGVFTVVLSQIPYAGQSIYLFEGATLFVAGPLAYLRLRTPGAALITTLLQFLIIGGGFSPFTIIPAVALEVAFAIGRYRSARPFSTMFAAFLAMGAELLGSELLGSRVLSSSSIVIFPDLAGAALGGLVAYILFKVLGR